MYTVVVDTTDGDTGIVYDFAGRDPFLTEYFHAAKQKKEDCERDFGHFPDKPVYKIYELVEREG